MSSKTYNGGAVDVTYDFRRCIHAERCVTHLAAVFDGKQKPWVNPDGAPVEQVAATIQQCPSGALHYHRHDGIAEPIPAINTVTVQQDGALYLRGDLSLVGSNGEVVQDTRLALCRCGQSERKPFCDASHEKHAFQAPASLGDDWMLRIETDVQGLKITPMPNGPLVLEGNLEIHSQDGQMVYKGTKVELCRCGGSGNKPFCDNTHDHNGFQAE